MSTPPSGDSAVLRCMEIWGGNEAFDNAVSVSGIDAWVYSEPHKGDRQGGDVHYISTCGHGHIARFAVADVSGHGASVGELSARLRSLMRKHINTLDQAKFVRALNIEFGEMSDAGKFATALLTSYYAPTKDLVICNAGHPPPLWFRAERGVWTLLTHETERTKGEIFNLPLGVIEPTSYYQFGVQLERGDIVMMYTDAVVEAMDVDEKSLGDAGLLELASGLDPSTPETINAQLLAALSARSGAREIADDITLITLYHTAADPPRLSPLEYAAVIGKMLHILPV